MDNVDAQHRRQLYRRHLTTPAQFSRRIDDDSDGIDEHLHQQQNVGNCAGDNGSSGEPGHLTPKHADIRRSSQHQQQLGKSSDAPPISCDGERTDGHERGSAEGQCQGRILQKDARHGATSTGRPRSPRQAVAMAARAMTTSSMWTRVRSRIMSKVMRPDFIHPAVVAQEIRRQVVDDDLRRLSHDLRSNPSTSASGSYDRQLSPRLGGDVTGDNSSRGTTSSGPRDVVCSGVEFDAILKQYRQDWCGDGEDSETGVTARGRPDGAALSSSVSASSCVALDQKNSQASLNSSNAATEKVRTDNSTVPVTASQQQDASSSAATKHKKHSSKKKQQAASDVISLSDVLYSGQLTEPPDVVFDDQGQTWDVYGAEFDPSILGAAIQKHLFKMMSLKSDDKPEVDTPERQQPPPSLPPPPQVRQQQQQQQLQMGVDEKMRRRESRTTRSSVRNFLTVLCSLAFRRRNNDHVDHV
jgi:hypothetical protein